MRTPAKVLLGAATLCPLGFLAFMHVFSLMLFATIRRSPETLVKAGSSPLQLLFPITGLNVLVVLALLIFYVRDLFRNPGVREDRRVLWAVLLFCGGPISMPIYSYLYIWNRKS